MHEIHLVINNIILLIKMLKKIFKHFIKLIDGLLYGFVGPFSIMFIIPQFLKKK